MALKWVRAGRAACRAARRKIWTDAHEDTATRIAAGVVQGNRFLLSKAITHAESTRLDHRRLSAVILDKALRDKAALSAQVTTRFPTP